MEEVDFFGYFVLLAFAKTSNNNKKIPRHKTKQQNLCQQKPLKSFRALFLAELQTENCSSAELRGNQSCLENHSKTITGTLMTKLNCSL